MVCNRSLQARAVPSTTLVEAAPGRRLGAGRRWRTRHKKNAIAPLLRGRCSAAPNGSIMEHEGGRVSEGEQLRRRLPQITARVDHLLDSWLHGGRWL